MTTPARPVIGDVKCPYTGQRVPVKKDRRGKYFIVSPVGHQFLTTAAGQDWIVENARLWGDDPDQRPKDAATDNGLPLPPTPASQAKAEPEAKPDNPPAPKKRAFLDFDL